MVSALCDYRITLRISRLSLLRALWTLSSLRTPITLAFAQSESMSGSSHYSRHRPLTTSEEHNNNLLLDELSYLMAVDARNTATSVDQRLRALSTRATDLVRLMYNSGSSAYNTVNLLLTCARAVQQIGSRASARVYQRLVSHVLLHLRHHQSHIHVSQLSALLHAELSFTPSQHILLESILETHISQIMLPTNLVTLLRGLLSYTSKHATFDLRLDKCIQLVLYILQNPPDDVLSDAIAAIELSLHDSFHNLFPRFVRAFSALVRPDQSNLQIGGLSLRITSAHVTILFALLNVSRDEFVQAEFTSSLDAIFASSVAFDTSLLPSSASAGAPSVMTARKVVIANCLRHPAVQVRSDVVLQYLQSLLLRQDNSDLVVLDALYEAFASIPACRPSLLQTMFATLVDKYSPVNVLKAYAYVFETLAESSHLSFAFAECKDILSEGLQQMAYVPPVISTRVISSFVTVSVGIPSLVDPTLVFLRKLAASRAHTHQRVACAGFISILGHTHATPDAVTEACDNLAVIIDVARMPVRTSAIVRLLRFISERRSHYNRVSPLVQRAIEHLCPSQESNLVETGIPSEGRDDSVSEISLIVFFNKEVDKIYLKTPVPHLLRLCLLVHSQCREASDLLKSYICYLGNWRGALLDAVSASKTDIPVAARIFLLCALLQSICLSQGRTGSSEHFPIVTENHWKIYGVALVVRDSFKTREGTAKRNNVVSSSKLPELPRLEEITAREGVAARVESERLEDVGADDNVSLQVWVRALEHVDRFDGTGVFGRVVQSELLEGARSALEDAFNVSCIDKTIEPDIAVWCKPLLECICRAFVRSSPWEREMITEGRSSTPAVHTPEEDALSSSANTMITMSDSQVSFANGDRQFATDPCHLSDVRFLNELHLENEDVKRALSIKRLSKLDNAARISVRELCLKIVCLLIKKGVVEDAWSFVGRLCEGCLSQFVCESEQGSVSDLEKRDTSSPVEEDCVRAVKAVTKLFQHEFSCSLTVGLTSLYLGLIEVLLEQLVECGQNNDDVKSQVSTTIFSILREYSVQHLILMRHMVKVLLKALNLDEGIAFGIGLLEWLGSHTSLVDSRYCGVDDVEDNRWGKFDPDILEEFIQSNEFDVSSEEKDACVTGSISTEGRGAANSNEEGRNQGLLEMTGDKNESMNIIRSLCFNETTEGAVTSICCVFTLFSDVISRTFKFLKGDNSDPACHISKLAQVQKVAEGLSIFVKGQFIAGCVGENGRLEKLQSSVSVHPPLVQHRKRKRKLLSWPSDLEKKFGIVVFGLMDVLDIELRALAKELGSESGWSLEKLNSVASSCIHVVRVLYEETNTLAVIERISGELSLRWSAQERVEYAASLFVRRWMAWDKKKDAAASLDRRRRNLKGQSSSESRDEVRTLASLVKKLLGDAGNESNSKKQRRGWWGQHQERPMAGISNDETDISIGENYVGTRFMRVNKRNRIRSRNSYIDKVMLEDRERESFADLEDFVVEMGDDIT